MKSVNEYIGQELQWARPRRLRAEYELSAGDEVLVRLSHKRARSLPVHVEAADGNWLIERESMGRAIRVRAFETQTELATVTRGKNGQAILRFPDGREYLWQCTGFWRDVWTWRNLEGTPVLHVKRGALVQFELAAQGLPDISLLATLGWYLHKLQEEEAAVVAAIVPVIV